jgi:hypothetical protein
MEHEFTLKFALPANHQPVDDLVERLGEAGCVDAVVGIGQAGRIALEFTREANSAKSAIFSALATVKAAIPGAKLLEVIPDCQIERARANAAATRGGFLQRLAEHVACNYGKSGLVAMSRRGKHPRQTEWGLGFKGHTDAGIGHLRKPRSRREHRCHHAMVRRAGSRTGQGRD